MISSGRARQGLISHRIIWVLGLGTALAVAAMVLAWLVFLPPTRHSIGQVAPTPAVRPHA